MKKIYFIVLAGTVGFLHGCNDMVPPTPIENQEGIASVVVHQQVYTKVSLTDGASDFVSVAFKSGDKLHIFRPSAINTSTGFFTGIAQTLPFTIASGMGTKTAIFNADASGIGTLGVYTAVHPGTSTSFAITSGASGYFTFQLPDNQVPISTTGDISDVENYMCFMGAPIEVVQLSPPVSEQISPVSFYLYPITSVMRFHVQDMGGYTTGRTLKNIKVRSMGDDYFGSIISIHPDGRYHQTAPITNRVNTNIKTLDLSGFSGGGMTLNSSLTKAGSLALYCINNVFDFLSGFVYILEFDNGSFFSVVKPTDFPLAPGAVYEVAIPVDGSLFMEVPATLVTLSSSAGLNLSTGTQTTLSATVTPGSATVSSYEWESSGDGVVWVPIINIGSTFTVTMPDTRSQLHIKVTAHSYSGTSVSDVIVLTNTTQPFIDIPGSGPQIIYVDPNGGDPKLMLTRNTSTPVAYFQFGNVVAWTYPNTDPADYNPTGNVALSSWVDNYYATSGSGTVAHTVPNLLNGHGDPCRLVGYTESQVNAAITGSTPYAIDNGIWRLPTQPEMGTWVSVHSDWLAATDSGFGVAGVWLGTTNNKGDLNAEFFPATGYKGTPPTLTYSNVASLAWFWSNYYASYSSGSLLYLASGTFQLLNYSTNYGVPVRCVRQ